MNQKFHRYYSCLIRIWEAHMNDGLTLRASVERPGQKERVGFSNMEELFTFIWEDVAREDIGQKNSEDIDET